MTQRSCCELTTTPHPSTARSWAEVEESGVKSEVEAGGRVKIRGGGGVLGYLFLTIHTYFNWQYVFFSPNLVCFAFDCN